MPLPLDHLVFAVPDLEAACDDLARRLGVRPTAGGRHPGRGTHNALLALDGGAYLELLAPDPTQPEPAGGRLFGLGGSVEPRLLTWAVRTCDIDAAAAAARRAGHDPGPAQAMTRQAADGTVLRWRLTEPAGLVPFLIDWSDSPHPAAAAPPGAELVELVAEHPDPAGVGRLLAAIDVDLPVRAGPVPVLVATVRGPAGRVVLR